jgi:uncharacterized protein (TIGR00369 family)
MAPPSQTASLTPLAHGALNQCFGCGLDNPCGLRLKFFVDPELNVVCRVRLARRFAGPPGHAHGGIIATLLDEAMSKANRARNVLAMTRHIAVDYIRPVPLASHLTLTARHAETHGHRHHCEAQIADASGQVLAKGKAVFVEIPPDYLRKAALATPSAQR